MDFTQELKFYVTSSPVQPLIESDYASSSVNPELTNGLTSEEKLQLKIIQQDLLISALRKDHKELIIENYKQQERLSALELELAELKESKNSLSLSNGEKLSEQNQNAGLASEVNQSSLSVNIPPEDFNHSTETESNSSNQSDGVPTPRRLSEPERVAAKTLVDSAKFLEENFVGTGPIDIRPKNPENELNARVYDLFRNHELAFLKNIPTEEINKIMEELRQERYELSCKSAEKLSHVKKSFEDECDKIKIQETKSIKDLSLSEKFHYNDEIKEKYQALKIRFKPLIVKLSWIWAKETSEMERKYREKFRNLSKIKQHVI